VLAGCLALAAARAQETTENDLARKVDQVFAAYDRLDTPGCALGVVKGGAFIYRRAYGQGSLELGVPLTSRSIFYLASVSKQFTAASAVLAAEQGYLSLDDDVRKYVPELPSYGRPITLRQMLHHTSGYRDVLTLLELSGRALEDVHSTAEMLDLVRRQKALDFVPGEQFGYSNTNYWLMSVVIQRATGKSLAEFAADNIFRPLGMVHTRFHDDRKVVVPGRIPAYGTASAGGYQLNWSVNFDAVGDGGLLSSVDDLLLWERNFHLDTLGNGSLLRELQTRGTLAGGKTIEYALGLGISEHRGLAMVQHGGAMFGYRTAIVRFPGQGLSVVTLCNVGAVRARDLATQVAEIYLASELAAVPAAENVRKDLSSLAGMYRSKTSHSVIKVAVADDALSLDGQTFRPVTASRFASTSRDTVEFAPSDGRAAALTLTSVDAEPERFERFEPHVAAAADLARYEGTYYSSELQATYRLAADHGQLMLTIGWLDPVVLEPIAPDEFRSASGLAVVFRRDSTGASGGFDLFAWGIKDVAFSRTAPSTD
jgi:CubicO group peptidase (beta-lactamase class C family)